VPRTRAGGPTLGTAQAAVYAAEAEALAGLGRQWRRLQEAQAYVDHLVDSSWFGERWPAFVSCLVRRRGSGAVWSCAAALEDAEGVEGLVLLAPGHLGQSVLLHELAHLLAGADQGHSCAFVGIQLELVRHEMGFPAWADYRRALRRRWPGPGPHNLGGPA
jgi:hypothetical protein